jgi:hypothetical protein
MENSQGKNSHGFSFNCLNAKIFSAQQIFARAERVPPRGGSRVNHTLPARFVRW